MMPTPPSQISTSKAVGVEGHAFLFLVSARVNTYS